MIENPKKLQDTKQRLKHWDKTYKNDNLPTYPSQFAVFVCDYLDPNQNIVEFGSGSGRDTVFFGGQGYNVIGLDGSETAISKCSQLAAGSMSNPPLFNRLLIEENWASRDLKRVAMGIKKNLNSDKATMIYARFFLHTLTSNEQSNFLNLLRYLNEPGSMYAFEFRTHRDQGQSKIARPHYRRFINPLELLDDLNARGFTIDYFIEGFGMAKYKTEDAHVARVVFHQRNGNARKAT